MLKRRLGRRCVYIAPLRLHCSWPRSATPTAAASSWPSKQTFGKTGVAVEMLCGETTTDLKLLERGSII